MLAVQVDYMNAVENRRHDIEQEVFNTMNLQENKRHSKVLERLQERANAEIKRSNKANERIKRGELSAKEEANRIAALNAETQRIQSDISQQIANENARHNLALESIDLERNNISRLSAEANKLGSEASWLNARSGERNAETNRINAEVNQRNAATNANSLTRSWYESDLRRKELEEKRRSTNVGATTNIIGDLFNFAKALF